MSEYFCLSYFAGIGGFSLGAKALEIRTLGVEWIPELADLYRKNVGDCVVANVATLDPSFLNIPPNSKLIFQISPPCIEYSLANINRDSTSECANLLSYCFDHTIVLNPEIIILENVVQYAKSDIYQRYVRFLEMLGYQVKQCLINSADFGVPQSRVRLIMIALKADQKMPEILKTHRKSQHIGWYEAIADIIPSLPKSKLTDAQRGAIAHNFKVKGDDLAWLVSGQDVSTTKKSGETSFTVTASSHKAIPRMLIQRIGYYNGKPQTRLSNETCWTIKATLADDGNEGKGRSKVIDCVLDGGDVRSLDVKSIARLQSFPDWYQWSGNNRVDITGIGNSVPPLLAKKILKCLVFPQ